MSTVALDFDDQDRFRIDGIPVADPSVFQPLKPIVTGISPNSSIERSDKVSGDVRTHNHRPRLEPPKHYMLDLLEMHQGVERVVSKEVSLFKIQSKTDLADIERLEKEKEAVFRKNAEEAATRNNWTVLGTIAQYLASGASITVGASLLATAPLAGAMLIVSGVAGLTNRVMQDTGGWQAVAAWLSKSVEHQKKIAHFFEMSFIGIELGVGLVGGGRAYYQGAFSMIVPNGKALVDTAGASIKVASQGLGATSQLGKSFADKRIADLYGRMRIIDALAERTRMEMSREANDVRNMIETAQAIGQDMHKAVASSEIQDL